MKRNKISSGLEDEEDIGWSWIIRVWQIVAENPAYLVGLIVETELLQGVIIETEKIEGVIIESQEVEGKI